MATKIQAVAEQAQIDLRAQYMLATPAPARTREVGSLMATKTEAIAEQAAKDLRAQYAVAKAALMRRIAGMADKGNPHAMLTLAQTVSTLVAIEKAEG
jgi:hypothetical protein